MIKKIKKFFQKLFNLKSKKEKEKNKENDDIYPLW